MVWTWTHGIVLVVLNHTHTRGPSIGRMWDYLDCKFYFVENLFVEIFFQDFIGWLFCKTKSSIHLRLRSKLNPSCPPPLEFFRRNFFLGKLSFLKPTLTINILMYYKLWQTLKKRFSTKFQIFSMVGYILCNSGSPVQLGLTSKSIS